MSEKAPLIKCNACRGTGAHPLGKDMWKTLQMVRKLKFSHSLEIATALKWSRHQSAINNRLSRLLKLGLVTRTRKGPYLYYSPAKPHSHAQPEQHP